jgi:signal transduction histidine kinase
VALSDLAPAPAASRRSPPTFQEVELLRRQLRRLALDVHDGPMQSLVAVGQGLTGLRDRLSVRGFESSTEAAEQLALMVAELASAERALRELITSLEEGSKALLDPLDLIAREELARFSRACAASIELEVPSGVRPDSHSQEIAIRSVLREALNNIARHAQASNVCVQVRAHCAVIRLEVEDDGRGFEPAAVSADRIGLIGMRERLRLLGGEFEIRSKLGGPTRIRATFRRWRPPEAHVATR